MLRSIAFIVAGMATGAIVSTLAFWITPGYSSWFLEPLPDCVFLGVIGGSVWGFVVGLKARRSFRRMVLITVLTAWIAGPIVAFVFVTATGIGP